MGASITADISMIDRRSKAYFYENIYVVYKDNRGKLRFTIKVKMVKMVYGLRKYLIYH